jgi:antitoxin MazE
MSVALKMWGNSVAVRIPAALMEAAHLQVGDAVELREEGGRLIIEPVRPAKFDLEALLGGITEENLHALVGFGPPVGKEVL